MCSTMWFVTHKKFNRITDLLIRSGVIDVTLPIGRSRIYDRQATLLHLAAGSGKLCRVKLLLQHGADLNAKDSKNKSVLHYAITCKNVAVTDYLVSAGADVNARDRQGLSVLHYAILSGSNEVIDILIQNGADLEAVDERGWSAMHIAVLVLSTGSNIFIDHDGVSLDTRNILNLRPTRVAIDLTRERIVCMLLDHGANINMKTQEGHFPLFYAVITGHRNMVKLLISKGAGLNNQTVDGETALIAACQRGLSKIVEILLCNHADVALKSKHGAIALSSVGQDDQTAQVIVRHIAKLKAGKQLVDENSLKAIRLNEELQRYYDKCESELERMKNEKIEESCNMSYYYILSKNLEKIASLAKNYDVVKAFEKDEFRDKYPIYAKELETKFTEAMARRNFSHNMEHCLRNTLSNFHVPDVAIKNIVSYLRFEDFNV
ncbi:putative ankyrin repeat protein RF_0381 [Nasonia vitripennis]|uniref:Ankyrin repeat protein n=1 Tax=Nasonia vitripennis TaxID=7425 RepID=A0A7M7H5A7_NASVI|nr:putative ankyrin repeat protein RF_0381 [Nasonia vitripennis]